MILAINKVTFIIINVLLILSNELTIPLFCVYNGL
jgi:hypothetical protein